MLVIRFADDPSLTGARGELVRRGKPVESDNRMAAPSEMKRRGAAGGAEAGNRNAQLNSQQNDVSAVDSLLLLARAEEASKWQRNIRIP